MRLASWSWTRVERPKTSDNKIASSFSGPVALPTLFKKSSPTIVVVANLKPAVIRGVESNGMLLAASKGDKMRVVTVDGEIASGATVK